MLNHRDRPRARTGGPPRLDLQLWRRAKLLLLLNCLPLLGGVVVAIGWWQGRLTIRPGSSASLTTLGILVGACLLFALAVWVVLPLARWLREYPLWRFRNGSGLVWILPAIAGTIAWIGIGLAGTVAALAALVLIGSGLVRLLHGG